MASKIIRERIHYLYERLISSRNIEVSADNEVSDEILGELEIRRVPFVPENIHDKEFNRSQEPPILFQAMTPERLAQYPFNASAYASEPVKPWLDFPEYLPERDSPWGVHHQTYAIAEHLDYYAAGMARKHLRPQAVSLLDVQGLEGVKIPNSLFRYAAFRGAYSDLRFNWSAHFIIEPERVNGQRVYPHLTIGVCHTFYGHEETIIWGELAAIVDAMNARSQQQVITEQEEEELQEPEALPPSGPRAFDREERFPILLLSFLGPRHGRVLYACMDDEQLVIRQSRLYSFETLARAPVDLFARLHLSQPLGPA